MEKSVTDAADMKDPEGGPDCAAAKALAGVLDASGIKETFGLKDIDASQLAPLTLAYVGDAVYELIVRTLIVGQGDAKPDRLHRKTSAVVNAHAQAVAAERIRPLLSEEELGIYRRGRNAHPQTTAKHASVSDYRKATGFEALVGRLYLEGRVDRLMELVRAGLQDEDAQASG